MSEAFATVTRTWRRDGSTNTMTLDMAVENIARTGYAIGGPDSERREAIRRALLAGVTLQTPHATFALDGPGAG
jgi:hypothetical protein